MKTAEKNAGISFCIGLFVTIATLVFSSTPWWICLLVGFVLWIAGFMALNKQAAESNLANMGEKQSCMKSNMPAKNPMPMPMPERRRPERATASRLQQTQMPAKNPMPMPMPERGRPERATASRLQQTQHGL